MNHILKAVSEKKWKYHFMRDVPKVKSAMYLLNTAATSRMQHKITFKRSTAGLSSEFL